MSPEKAEEILAIKTDGPFKTVGEYVLALLITLLLEEESFNGKRPFGDSGWLYDITDPVIEHFDVDENNLFDQDSALNLISQALEVKMGISVLKML